MLSDFLYKLATAFSRIITSQKFYEKLLKFSLVGMNIGQGADVSNSGELNVLKYIKEKINKQDGKEDITIFDVGANVGEYSKLILNYFQEFKINLFAFEPSKATFNKLESNIQFDFVKLYNLGFSDQAETTTLYSNQACSGIASLYHRKLDHFNVSLDLNEEVRLDTLDNFCGNKGIKQIDLLKIDVEGHELNVLKGAKNLIDHRAIKFIQFEFGGCNLDSRTYFKDFFYLLSPQYRLYRILRNDLCLVEKYTELNEIFTTTNYLAVLKDETIL